MDEQVTDITSLSYKYRFHIDKLRASFPDALEVEFKEHIKVFGVIIKFKDEGTRALPLERRVDIAKDIRYVWGIKWRGWLPSFSRIRTTPPKWVTKVTTMPQLVEIINKIKLERALRG